MSNDRWLREAELINTYGLTKAEAEVVVAMKEIGDLHEVADRLGIEYQTAKNQHSSANKKMRKDNMTDIVITTTKEQSQANLKATRIMALFFGKVFDAEVICGVHSIVIKGIPKMPMGDMGWMYNYIINPNSLAMCGHEAEPRADQAVVNEIFELYTQKNADNEQKMGMNVLMHWLDNQYARYDIYG